MKGYISNEAETKSMRDIVAKAMGLPEVGVAVGGGKHGDPGVTLYYFDVISHPTNGLWAMPVDEVVENIPNVPSRYSLLDQTEKDLLARHLSSLQNITDDWYQFDLP